MLVPDVHIEASVKIKIAPAKHFPLQFTPPPLTPCGGLSWGKKLVQGYLIDSKVGRSVGWLIDQQTVQHFSQFSK